MTPDRSQHLYHIMILIYVVKIEDKVKVNFLAIQLRNSFLDKINGWKFLFVDNPVNVLPENSRFCIH